MRGAKHPKRQGWRLVMGSVMGAVNDPAMPLSWLVADDSLYEDLYICAYQYSHPFCVCLHFFHQFYVLIFYFFLWISQYIHTLYIRIIQLGVKTTISPPLRSNTILGNPLHLHHSSDRHRPTSVVNDNIYIYLPHRTFSKQMLISSTNMEQAHVPSDSLNRQ